MKIIKYTKIWFAISIIITAVGLGAIVYNTIENMNNEKGTGISASGIFFKGFNRGIDFTGGVMFQLKFDKKIEMKQFDDYLKTLEAKYPGIKSKKLQISNGNTVMLRLPDMDEAAKSALLLDLKAVGNYQTEQVNRVGATIGDELASKALNAVLIGSLLIVAYVTLRFRFSYAVGGIVALLHDALVAAGFISLFHLEIDGAFIAAILTILGYSINDTIVVYDRIRENQKKHPELGMDENIDHSINQVIGRSINTVVTVLFALIALLVFGGDSLKTFTITLLVGVTTGMYSSIFVASPIVYLIDKNKKKKGELKK